jgi:hypothetical protein
VLLQQRAVAAEFVEAGGHRAAVTLTPPGAG